MHGTCTSHSRAASSLHGQFAGTTYGPRKISMATKNKIVCFIMLALLGLGFYDVFFNFEENGCAMTYMFQWPSYVDTEMGDTIRQRFPKYSLSLYGEGTYLKESRNLKLKGIPVLFIPGNAGSYKQVRSLGSVALRKAEFYSFHFNYFTINFNEELTGIYGGTLHKQTEYVHECIKYILTLYKHRKNPPTNVVLVGHSMGGLIARALFTLPDFQHSLVHTIITQATPHVSPVVAADKHLVDFYSAINKYWRDHQNSTRLQDVTVVSIGGGHRDTMVRLGLTSLDGIVAPSRGLSVNAMSVPKVWLSTDHQCIVWCKELVLATKRALFQMVDLKLKQLSSDSEYRMKVFRHHFVSHNGNDKFSLSETKPKTFEGTKFELATDSQVYSLGKRTKKTTHYLFPVEESTLSHTAFTALVGSEMRDWLFICKEGNSTSCSRGVDISGIARLIPPLKSGMREALVMLADYPNAKHVVLKVPLGSSVPVTAELYDTNQRNINFTLPGPFSAASGSIALEFTEVGATFYNITMLDFSRFHFSYEAKLEPLICENHFQEEANTTLRLHIPWAEGQDTFSVSPAGQVNRLSFKLPWGWPDSYNQSAQLYAYVNPQCRYTIRTYWSLQEKMGQVMRFHAFLLPNFAVIVLVFTISFYLKHIYTDKAIESFNWMQSNYARPTSVALVISIFRGLINPYDSLDETFELRSLEDRNISFGILPMAFFLFGYTILTQLAMLTSCKLGIFANLAVILQGTKASEHQLNQAGPTPWLMYVVIGSLIALSSATCGTVGLILALLLYTFKVIGLKAKVIRLSSCLNLHGVINEANSHAATSTTEEPPMTPSTNGAPAESTVDGPSDKPSNDKDLKSTKKLTDEDPKPRDPSPLGLARDTFNYHFALLLLLWCLCVLNAPALIVWLKDVRHSLHLSNDPSIYTAAIVCSTMAVLLDGRYNIPTSRGLCKLVSWMFHLFAILMVLYTLESMYRVSYFVTAVFVSLAMLQIFQGSEKTASK